MSRKNISGLVLAALLILIACTPEKNAGSGSSGSVSYQMDVKESKYPPRDSLITEASIRIEYPIITEAPSAAIKDTINHFITGYLLSQFGDAADQGSLDKQVDNFIRDFKEFREDFPDSPGNWYDEKKVSVLTDTLGILCLVFFHDFYTGGAHPNSSLEYVNFDISTGDTLTLGDIFISGYESDLNKITEKEFLKVKNLSPEEDLEKAGYWFENNQFKVNDNFAITDQGLRFYFNSYEIAPYSMGPTRLDIPYEALHRIIDDNGPLKNFVM
jgi:hypothetical protein